MQPSSNNSAEINNIVLNLKVPDFKWDMQANPLPQLAIVSQKLGMEPQWKQFIQKMNTVQQGAVSAQNQLDQQQASIQSEIKKKGFTAMIAGAVAGIATGIGGFFAAQKWLKWGGWRTSITSFLTAVVGGAATAGIVGRMGGSDIETKINTLNAQQASGMQQVHDAQSTVLLEYLKEVQAKALEAQKVEPTKAEEPAKAPGQTPAADAPTPAQETMSPPATITADPKDTTPAAQDTSAPASQSSAPEPSAVAPETKPSEGPATAPVTTEGKEQGIAPAPEGAEGESMAKKFAKEPAESKVAALAQQQAAQQSATAQI